MDVEINRFAEMIDKICSLKLRVSPKRHPCQFI